MTYEILRFSEKPVIESSQPFRESPLYTLNKQYITINMWGPYNTIVLKQWAHRDLDFLRHINTLTYLFDH